MHCGTEISSTGRLVSERLAKTSPHFMVGAQKNTEHRARDDRMNQMMECQGKTENSDGNGDVAYFSLLDRGATHLF